MGAWGSGSFENDAALDWAAGVKSIDDLRGPFDRLKALGTDRADADLASEVVAAAESIAMLMGRRSGHFPEELRKRLSGEPDSALYHQARGALIHVIRSSELAELWEESAGEGEPNEWLDAMTGLIDRLNPDVEATPWGSEEVEQTVGQVLQTCAFCDQPVEPEELFLMTLFDASNKVPGDRGKWLHLRCLNARMHHKHAIIDLKFDPNNMPD